MPETGRVNKVFCPGILINISNNETTMKLEISTNVKLAFTNVPLRHKSACVIQK